jgi:hypothetical protein
VYAPSRVDGEPNDPHVLLLLVIAQFGYMFLALAGFLMGDSSPTDDAAGAAGRCIGISRSETEVHPLYGTSAIRFRWWSG